MRNNKSGYTPPKVNHHKNPETNYLGTNGRGRSQDNQERNDYLNLLKFTFTAHGMVRAPHSQPK